MWKLCGSIVGHVRVSVAASVVGESVAKVVAIVLAA